MEARLAQLEQSLLQANQTIQALQQTAAQAQQDAADAAQTAAQAAAAAAGVGGPAPAQRPNRIKVDTFGNESREDWLVYKHHFEQARQLNQYTQDEAKLALASAMRGRAAAAVMDLQVLDPNQTFGEFLESYENRFLPASASQLARTRFEQARQNKNEEILDFHARLRMLWHKAYPGALDVEPLIRHFSFGLRRKEVREQVVRSNPATYGAALEAAQNESSVLASCRNEFGGNANGAEAMEIGSINAMKKVGKALAAMDKRRTPGLASKVEAPKGGSCHFCDRPGHWRNNCPLLDKAKRFLNGRPKGGAGAKSSAGNWRKRLRQPANPSGGNKRGRFVALLEELLPETELEEMNADELNEIVAGLEYLDEEGENADAAEAVVDDTAEAEDF